jgi:hypothetical protein
MLIKKFTYTLLLVFCICVIINTILFIKYPDWFVFTYKKEKYTHLDSLIDSINYVSGILSTAGNNEINPITIQAKLWSITLQLIPYILIPIFIAMSS